MPGIPQTTVAMTQFAVSGDRGATCNSMLARVEGIFVSLVYARGSISLCETVTTGKCLIGFAWGSINSVTQNRTKP